MDKRWSLSQVATRQTRSRAKSILAGAVLLAWALSILACSQGYISQADLTATAAVRTNPVAALATTLAPANPDPATPGTTETVPPPADLSTQPPADVGEFDVTPSNTPTRPTRTATHTATPGPSPTPRPPILYYAQAGDTLPALAVHFGVDPKEITSPDPIELKSFIRPNQLLLIPDRLDPAKIDPKQVLIPDSEVVYSPSAVSFDIDAYVNESGGYLSRYKEWMSTGWSSGADVIKRVATENSINPRLLLAIIEYQSHWVTGEPQSLAQTDYPAGYIDLNRKGLYKQISWAVEQLSIGYYGWQSGLVTELEFENGDTVRLWPRLNAGTVAIAYYFSQLYDHPQWSNLLDSKDLGFPAIYTKMYGNPWLRAQSVEPLFPADFSQPVLNLPYPAGESWSFSGGPHPAWGPNGALAAVDLAPPSIAPGCTKSEDWVTAVATGLVVRTGTGVVVEDLDGDGHEQTGWVILYLHVATRERVKVGDWVTADDKLGHPSCEGGEATGTHVHIARKYNGQWILADGPIPMVLSGWRVYNGQEQYQGSMIRDGQEAVACTCGSAESRVMRYK